MRLLALGRRLETRVRGRRRAPPSPCVATRGAAPTSQLSRAEAYGSPVTARTGGSSYISGKKQRSPRAKSPAASEGDGGIRVLDPSTSFRRHPHGNPKTAGNASSGRGMTRAPRRGYLPPARLHPANGGRRVRRARAPLLDGQNMVCDRCGARSPGFRLRNAESSERQGLKEPEQHKWQSTAVILRDSRGPSNGGNPLYTNGLRYSTALASIDATPSNLDKATTTA